MPPFRSGFWAADCHDRVAARLRSAGSVFAEDEAAILIAEAGSTDELCTLVSRRASGLPLEQVVGWAAFMGLRVVVRPGVFVPRRRTEWLARAATDAARPGAVAVELCCGAAAVSAVLLRACGSLTLFAADIDPAAVRCARENLPSKAHVCTGDLYDALPRCLRGRVDILMANAPYVPSGQIPLLPAEARLHEPLVALDGGADGLDVQRRIIAEAPGWLRSGGCILMETAERQAPATAGLMRTAGIDPRVLRSEELDATVVVGTYSA
jgi:release factor glutamine methyltransferase